MPMHSDRSGVRSRESVEWRCRSIDGADGQGLRLKSPAWPSPLSSQALGLDQLNVLCQSPYKAHVTFAVLLDLDILVTPLNEDILLTPLHDDFIILVRLPMLLF